MTKTRNERRTEKAVAEAAFASDQQPWPSHKEEVQEVRTLIPLCPSFQSPAFASIPWTPYESEDQQPSRCSGHEVNPRVQSRLEGRMQVGGRMEEIRHNTPKRCHTPNNLVRVHISVSCLKVQWHEIAKETVMLLSDFVFYQWESIWILKQRQTTEWSYK